MWHISGLTASQSFRDSGYGSSQNSSFSSVSSRSFSTQASVQPSRNIRDNVGLTGFHGDSTNRYSNNSFSSNNNQRPTNQRTNNHTNQSRNNSRTPLIAVNTNSMNSENVGSGNAVVCNCGNDAIQLTVRKEGPNTGISSFNTTCSIYSVVM